MLRRQALGRLREDEGFSKMKIIVIVAALMILTGTLIPLSAWLIDRAKISEIKENLAAICEAQEAYRRANDTYHLCKRGYAGRRCLCGHWFQA